MAEVKVRVTGDNSGFNAALTRSRVAAQAFVGRMRSLTAGIGGQIAGLFAGATIAAAVKRTIQWADQLNDTSQRLDVNVEKLQAWEYAAIQTGSSLEKLTTTIEKLRKSQADAARGLGTAKAGLAAFGITGQDDVETMLRKISERVKSGNFSSGALMGIGGRGATTMIPALKQWEELSRLAEESGVIIKEEQVAVLEKLNDQLTFMGRYVMAELAPAIQLLFEKLVQLTSAVKGAQSFFGEVAGSIASVGTGIEFGDSIKTIGEKLFKFVKTQDAGLGKAFFEGKKAFDAEVAKGNATIQQFRTPAPTNQREAPGDTPFKAFRPTKSDVDSLAKVGLFTQSGMNAGPILDIQRRMERHLAKIVQNTDTTEPDPFS